MIKVGIDVSSFGNSGKFRGIGMYTSRLISALKLSNEIIIKEISRERGSEDIDILHYPFFDLFFLTLPLYKKHKTVVTIHDCIPLVYPDQYPTGIKGKIKFIIQRISLKSVDAVITDSESSKNDIIRFLNVPENKIKVVYLASDPIFRKLPENSEKLLDVSKKFKLPSKFVLYVGDVNYNKNLLRMIEAFSMMNNKNYHLVLVGKAFENKTLSETASILDKINDLKIANRVHLLGFVNDDELLGIYNLAQIYCMPSLYEGFGLQILEAMACGCPVITSNISSTSEISGKAALLVNPANVEEIVSAINKFVSDTIFKEKMIRLGFDQVKNFSWSKTAHETIRIYKKALYD